MFGQLSLEIIVLLMLYTVGTTVAAAVATAAEQLLRGGIMVGYSTFSLAFKQRMGQSVASWMRNTANNI